MSDNTAIPTEPTSKTAPAPTTTPAPTPTPAPASESKNEANGRRGEAFTPRLVVLGVGGAGGNVVNNLIANGLQDVDFMVANTDMQDLEKNQAPTKIQIGVQTTQGLGTGANPESGKLAAEESIEEVLRYLHGTHLLFITAGMGGGTGTGATSVIAQRAREMGILTFGMVTKPFEYEGLEKMRIAEDAIAQLQKDMDKLVVISNQNLFALSNETTTLADGFCLADKVLSSGIAGITEAITRPGLMNVDFADVRTVMQETGHSMLGTGLAEGEDRAVDAINDAIKNRLVDDVRLAGASTILLNITGDNVTMHETHAISERLREEAGEGIRLLMGVINDSSLAGQLKVCVMAAGIQPTPKGAVMRSSTPESHSGTSDEQIDDVFASGENAQGLGLGTISDTLPQAIQPRAEDTPTIVRKKGFLANLFRKPATPDHNGEEPLPDSQGWVGKLLGDPEEIADVNAQYDAERTTEEAPPAKPVEAKAEPKVEAKVPPKVEPKIEPKVEPKAPPKIEPKEEPKAKAPPIAKQAEKPAKAETPPAPPAPPVVEEKMTPARPAMGTPPTPVQPKKVEPKAAPALSLADKRKAKATSEPADDDSQLEIPTFLRRQNN